MNKRRGFVAAAVFLGLSACTPTPDPKEIGPYPGNYREVVKGYVVENFFDPGSVRDAAITDPKRGHLFFQQGWITCLKVNAKNRMGGYTGRKTIALLINRGEVVNSQDNPQMCDNLYFQDFDELENL